MFGQLKRTTIFENFEMLTLNFKTKTIKLWHKQQLQKKVVDLISQF